MKKVLPFLLLQSLLATFCVAQNLITKVPANAIFVLKYSNAGLSQKLPAGKFDSYTSLKKKLFEELKIDPKTTLDEMGIDLQQDAYQYLVNTDTTNSFVTLAAIKNSAKFNSFIQKKNISKIAFETKAGFQLYPVSNSVYLGWDGKTAALVILNYNDYSYYHEEYTAAVDSTKMFSNVGKSTPYADSSIVLEPVDTAAKIAIAVDTAKMVVEDSKAIEAPPVVDDNLSDSAKAADAAQALVDSANAGKYRIESEKFEAAKIIKDSIIQKSLAENILLTLYDSAIVSIETEPSYNKLVDRTADISAWIGSINVYDGIGRFRSHGYGYVSSPFIYGYNLNNWLGYKQAVNVFFENTKVRVEQKLTSSNDSNLQLFKNIFNSQQNPVLANYVHPSDLGYMSVSVNTEAMLNYYYPMLKSMLGGMSYMSKYSEAIDAYVDLLQIAIDEKGLSDMVPGNAIFVLHSLKQKQVEYVSYDYDKNFNSTPTTKTKTEISPDFTFVFETKNERIFNKFVNLPVKFGKENNFAYTKTGDYYTLVLGKDNILDKLYFMVKDGKCIITTSLQDLANSATLQTSVSPEIKQSILNSNYSGMFNFKGLVKSLSGEVTDKKNKKMMNYLQNNLSDATFQSSIKGDVVQTTAILNIAGNHKNSFEYFFNVIEKLLEISGQ